MRRRDFIKGIVASATAWPLAARAQQAAMPVIGLLDPRSPDALADRLRGFRQGLKETGFVEGENIVIEYRWADNQMDRLPALASDLVRRRVALIAVPGGPDAALAAKAATTTIPIIFLVGEDPVRLGLVASLAQPGGNLTGINFFSGELTAKRLDLLRTLVPGAVQVAVLVNPASPKMTETTLRDLEPAGRAMGLQIRVINAGTSGEIAAAFAAFERERPDALLVGLDPFFNSRRVQLVALATRYAVPASYVARDFVEVGGLLSYGGSIVDAWRQVGIYSGRVFKGAKPEELPVVQSSKLELVINVETARMLGLTVPPSLLGIADERTVAAFAGSSSNSGLLVTANSLADWHREIIITLAARSRLVAIYPFRYYATSGGLISYGPDLVDPYRRAAAYVDRILKGEKPAEIAKLITAISVPPLRSDFICQSCELREYCRLPSHREAVRER
jgi:putative ABC transport system substrate-binding protein